MMDYFFIPCWVCLANILLRIIASMLRREIELWLSYFVLVWFSVWKLCEPLRMRQVGETPFFLIRKGLYKITIFSFSEVWFHFLLLLLIQLLESHFLEFLLWLLSTGMEFGGILWGVQGAFLLKAFLFVSVRHQGIQVHLKFLLCSFFNH